MQRTDPQQRNGTAPRRREAPPLFQGYPEKKILTWILILAFSTAFSAAANLNLGMAEHFKKYFSGMDTEALWVTCRMDFIFEAAPPFVPDDIEKISRLPEVEAVYGQKMLFETTGEKTFIVMPVKAEFLRRMGMAAGRGKLFSGDSGNVAVALNPASYKNLFGTTPLEEAKFTIEGKPFRVTAIAESTFFTDMQSMFQALPILYVPWESVPEDNGRLLALTVVAKNRHAKKAVLKVLDDRNPSGKYYANEISRRTMKDFYKLMKFPITVAWLFVACVAIVSMIGITGMLVLALEERRRDLALMRLLGASKKDIIKYILGSLFALSAAPVSAGFAAGIFLAWYFSSVIQHPLPLPILFGPRLAAVLLCPFAYCLIAAIVPVISLLRKDPVSFYTSR